MLININIQIKNAYPLEIYLLSVKYLTIEVEGKMKSITNGYQKLKMSTNAINNTKSAILNIPIESEYFINDSK